MRPTQSRHDMATGMRTDEGCSASIVRSEQNRQPLLAPGIMAESVVQLMWRHRWTMLLTTAVVLTGAVMYLLKATPIYSSTSRIYVEQSGPRIMKEIEEGVMTGSKNYLYTQAELLTSVPILTDALDNPSVKARQMKVSIAPGWSR